MKLYELSHEFATALEKYDPDQDELGLLSDVIDGIAQEIEAKSKNIVHLIANWEADVTALDNEIERLQNIKRQKAERTKWLRNYLAANLEHAGIDKLDLGTHKLSFRKSERVEIDDEKVVPGEYKRIKVEINKALIKKMHKQGVGVNGTRIVEYKNLQIR